ncbi:MAG: hypothetical protein HOQ24_01230 [Mycobacteriaceae bacterium]|nr:hypothetical protein [Mycobacteriaceae bacterium]
MRRVLLMVSAFNGLSQRAALALQAAGHSVRTAVVADGADMAHAVAPRDFDVIICPFLKAKIPAEIYRRWPTVIVHPGPVGDRGPSSLDWAITDDEPVWGVTALAAVEDMDAGPIWASRTFPMPQRLRKSAVYNGPVADAAVDCVLEVAAKAASQVFAPLPPELAPRPVAHARLRPTMGQQDRGFSWDADAHAIVRRIRAADGFPGVLADLAGRRLYLYDAHPDSAVAAAPGTIVARHHHAVRIACGTGSIWIGYLRAKAGDGPACKGPAVEVLAATGIDVSAIPAVPDGAYREISYERSGHVATVTFDFYNGAMSTAQCRRLADMLRHAAQQDTRVLVLRGSVAGPYFSNGIHLGAIELADNPAAEAWANIKAINEVCRELLLCDTQLTVAAFTGNAGAGGVMLPLGADVVAARSGVVLNPHYATMGLYGSELHTFTLPRRVGAATARRLTADCLPIGAAEARDIGLVDRLGPRENFDAWLDDLTAEYSDDRRWTALLDAKRARLAAAFAEKPLDAYELAELGEMATDIFDDRRDFAAKRRDFMDKHGSKKVLTAQS